jgi:hypothetical protein
MAAVAAHREGFEFDRHCGGSNLDATPNDIISRIERYSGVKVAKAFAIPDLDREVKWHCKYARQNGTHVSATFMIDGLVEADMSSGVLSPIGCRAYARNRHATKLRNGHRICNGVSCPTSSLRGMPRVGSFARLQ